MYSTEDRAYKIAALEPRARREAARMLAKSMIIYLRWFVVSLLEESGMLLCGLDRSVVLVSSAPLYVLLSRQCRDNGFVFPI